MRWPTGQCGQTKCGSISTSRLAQRRPWKRRTTNAFMSSGKNIGPQSLWEQLFDLDLMVQPWTHGTRRNERPDFRRRTRRLFTCSRSGRRRPVRRSARAYSDFASNIGATRCHIEAGACLLSRSSALTSALNPRRLVNYRRCLMGAGSVHIQCTDHSLIRSDVIVEVSAGAREGPDVRPNECGDPSGGYRPFYGLQHVQKAGKALVGEVDFPCDSGNRKL